MDQNDIINQQEWEKGRECYNNDLEMCKVCVMRECDSGNCTRPGAIARMNQLKFKSSTDRPEKPKLNPGWKAEWSPVRRCYNLIRPELMDDCIHLLNKDNFECEFYKQYWRCKDTCKHYYSENQDEDDIDYEYEDDDVGWEDD